MREKFFLDLNEVQRILGYTFKDLRWLKLAVVHRSFWNEHKEAVEGYNERLEFLGDAVLGLIVSEQLFRANPLVAEGVLSDQRSQLVGSVACAAYLQALGISQNLLLGKGEEKRATGKGRETILADFFEALIGAIYLDGGLEAAKHFFLSHFSKAMDSTLADPARNWKAELQDLVQRRYRIVPRYELVSEEGPSHARHFCIAVYVGDRELAQGYGSSKKEAQMAAAKEALLKAENL